MSNARVIKVPKSYYDQAVVIKKAYFAQHQMNVPLWRCMIALEKGNDYDDFFGRKRP